VGPSGKPVVCTVEDVSAGYEVRVGYSSEDVLYTRLLSHLEAARHFADSARHADGKTHAHRIERTDVMLSG
jgi:hypothetical protein